MKKIGYLLFSLFVFVSSSLFVNAKTLEGQTYLDGVPGCPKCLSLFNEVKNYSPIAQFLNEQGNNIGNYYVDKYFTYVPQNVSVSILGADDLFHFSTRYTIDNIIKSSSDSDYRTALINKLKSKLKNNSDDFDYNNVYYIVAVRGDNSAQKIKFFDIGDNGYSIDFGKSYLFFYDKNFNLINYMSPENYFTIGYSLDQLTDYVDITTFYGINYYNSSDHFYVSSTYDKIYSKLFCYDDNCVKTDNNAGYTWWDNFWSNFGSNFQLNFGLYNMNFVYDSPFYSSSGGAKTLSYYWFSTSSITVPENYEFVDISSYKYGYYFDPKGSCKSQDYYLYYNANTELDRHKLYLNYYTLNSDKNELELYKSYYVFSSKINQFYMYNPFSDIGDKNLNDFVIHFTQSSSVPSFRIYYNSSCYDVNYSDGSTNFDLVFADGTHYTINGNEQMSNYLFSSNSMQNDNSSLVSGGSSNQNVNSSSTNSFNFSDIVSNIGSYVSNFTSSISALVSMCTVFLTGLPPQILSILLSMFTIGLIILLIKVFH